MGWGLPAMPIGQRSSPRRDSDSLDRVSRTDSDSGDGAQGLGRGAESQRAFMCHGRLGCDSDPGERLRRLVTVAIGRDELEGL